MMVARIWLLLLMVAPSPSYSEMYKWVDEHGDVHFSDQKPESAAAEEVKVKVGPVSTSSIARDSVVGRWESNRGGITAKVDILETGKFRGVIIERGVVAWTYAGSWTLVGSELTWRYESSEPALPAEMQGKPDVNRVMSADGNTLTLSEMSGKTTIYRRLQ